LLLARRSWADSPVPQIDERLGGRLRVEPDLDALHPEVPYLVGVRPHRLGGVRIERGEPITGSDGQSKQVVHNYGHGASGITLSWGTARLAARLVEQALASLSVAPPSVAILGTGVVGLTTASELKRRFPDLAVTMYAKSTDVQTTTSWVAGGQFEPSGMWRAYSEGDGPERLAEMLRLSRDRVVESLSSGHGERYGIAERDHFTLDHDSTALQRFTPPDVVPAPEIGRLPWPRLSVTGRRYRLWLLNPMRMLPALVAEVEGKGVKRVARTFHTPSDVAKLPEPVVVNCTGLGAKTLFGDDTLIGQRGHIVRLSRTDAGQDWFFGGGCANQVISYCFCRQDDVVVGGTWGTGDERTGIEADDAEVFARVRNNARRVFAGDVSSCEV
jgi:glycine/D-amino acid oxidase-like deaminating enzyme